MAFRRPETSFGEYGKDSTLPLSHKTFSVVAFCPLQSNPFFSSPRPIAPQGVRAESETPIQPPKANRIESPPQVPLRTPTALNHTAQGCACRATLGFRSSERPTLKGLHTAVNRYNPFRVGPFLCPYPQGCARRAILACRIQRRWRSPPTPLNPIAHPRPAKAGNCVAPPCHLCFLPGPLYGRAFRASREARMAFMRAWVSG